MKKSDVFPVWGRILQGRKPFLAIEITDQCPLNCPGCYAFAPGHRGPEEEQIPLTNFKGDDLIERVLELVRYHRPMHVSIVGGEPLVRYRELSVLLPQLEAMGIEVQLVTSAVRPIPAEWAKIKHLQLCVSVDGLAEEHDLRRAPATYDRILEHIVGHKITVHCTITENICVRSDYLDRFSRFWSDRPEVSRIWFSLYTPQEGEKSEQRLTPETRLAAIEKLDSLKDEFPKIHMPLKAIEQYLDPPESPEKCIFAQVAVNYSPDLRTLITPCQLGGRPVCSECGCFGAIGFGSVGKLRIAGVPVGNIFFTSLKIGKRLGRNGAGPPVRPAEQFITTTPSQPTLEADESPR